ncbi:acyl-CoA N-acyltransferase [Colletotrichum phormii]|uniref:Acyl-CoA N-acyltransferase n=1 Tax=Colletotrichum phormii TaxID=359342 RepID=A0AAI9ZF19_9PEZI|nr:acyl-CoA N-acyltransferase [Colletotrichum phormii]KAK1623367.1 acyl-CoA N-acyltransferase [Colletotrichum phormii]
MAPQIIHLPDGQKFTVTPVFAGLFFKSHDLNTHNNPFPIGWTIVLNTEDEPLEVDNVNGQQVEGEEDRARRRHIHSFKQPTLQCDNLFISSISQPSSTEFKPAASPTRQIAMMLWVTLYWYFHQPQPSPYLTTDASRLTPEEARPKGEWRINIKRDGVLRGRNLIPKLERMGLIASLDSAVGTNLKDNGEEWSQMFVSRRMFWQIPGRLFLFTLQRTSAASTTGPESPNGSRPTSPARTESIHSRHHTPIHSPHQSTGGRFDVDLPGGPPPMTMVTTLNFPIGPFYSSSHLPTYYPPAPLMYTVTNGVRHPIRRKPGRMGEVFYSRYVPSVGQYLSFRVASLTPEPVPYLGPLGPKPVENGHLASLSDTDLLQSWLANPRVQKFWGDYSPEFLSNALSSKHSFPVIGMWDGVPFGYFEIYWVKEDILGQKLGSDAGDYDRGIHVFVGEEWARGRVPAWLTSLVHWCLTDDYRTMHVCLEPRIDNARFLQHLQYAGFAKEREVAFPHKQSYLMKLNRDAWEGPAL